MSDSTRHFTVVDDWVMLNQDVTATEYRVYSIIKANIRHTYGGIPETGFRATAAWVSAISNGLVAVSTAHRALQGLAKKGVLRRLNDPQSGEGADFEFVFNPDDSYEGPRSVMAKAAELNGTKSRSLVFAAIPLKHKPPRRDQPKHDGSPEVLMLENLDIDQDKEEPVVEPVVEQDIPPEEEFEFNLADLDELNEPKPSTDQPTPEMVQFAAELENFTARHREERLRLMPGACRRIAIAMKPILARGWEPNALAKRLSSELNPKIHSPEQLLISKAADLGDPPPNLSDGKVRMGGQVVDLSSFDLGFDHDTAAPSKGARAAQTSPGTKQRRESTSDRLARLARRSSR